MIDNFTLNVWAGGVFSKFMFVIQNLRYINTEFNTIYINNMDSRSLTESENIFNTILDQDIIYNGLSYNCKHLDNYSKFNPIENSPNINDYKTIVNKIRLKKTLTDKIEYHVNELGINSSVIGVHIRLCDMNTIHGRDYGILTFDDYLFELNKHITENSKIFVASDNYESIDKLKREFGNKILYINGFIRGVLETDDTDKLQLDNFKDYRLWEEAFIDMVLLSKCGTLLCRTSNLSNTSIIYSNTIKKIIRL